MCTVRRNLIKNKLLLAAVTFLSAISIGTAADFNSGGLGLSIQRWEEKVGKPDSKCPTNMPGPCYKGGKYMLIYKLDYVQWLEIYPRPLPYTYKMPGIGIKEARSIARGFIPYDSRLLKVYKSPTSGSTVELYMSESLRYLDSVVVQDKYGTLWINGEPGNFIIIYTGSDSDVKTMIIATGNNP